MTLSIYERIISICVMHLHTYHVVVAAETTFVFNLHYSLLEKEREGEKEGKRAHFSFIK